MREDGRNWSDAATSQGRPTAGNRRKQEVGEEGFFPRAREGNTTALPTSWFGTSRLQT